MHIHVLLSICSQFSINFRSKNRPKALGSITNRKSYIQFKSKLVLNQMLSIRFYFQPLFPSDKNTAPVDSSQLLFLQAKLIKCSIHLRILPLGSFQLTFVCWGQAQSYLLWGNVLCMHKFIREIKILHLIMHFIR